MAGVPEVLISPSDVGLDTLVKHPFFRRSSSKKLFRQDAHDEDLCHVEAEDSCSVVDSGIGSVTSSFSRTFSDCQLEEARNLDSSPNRLIRDISDGGEEGGGTGSNGKVSLEAKRRQEHFRASSGYGTGDSLELPDSLGNSDASSVFSELETTPKWLLDCDRLIRELMTERCIDDLDKIESFSAVEATQHLLFWRNEFHCDNDIIHSSDLLISDVSNEGSEGFVSVPQETERHDHFSELCVKVDTENASKLHSASMCHSQTGGNITEINCPGKQVDCTEARGLLRWLDKCYRLGHLEDCFLCERTLGNIMEHNKDCSEFHCPLPFCEVIKERKQLLKRHISMEEMKGEVSLVGKLSAMESMLSSVQSLSSLFVDGCQPGSAEAIPLAFLGRFGKFNVLLARMRKTGPAPAQPSTIVIKKVPIRENLLPALEIAKSLTHDKLVSLLNFVKGESHLVLISAFTSGVTFKELLLRKELYGEWEWRNHFCQVVSALSFLHEYRILFLNWELDNILIKSDGKEACLLISQGSLTLIPKGATTIPVDETLQEFLSPFISAPEILQRKEVGFAADVWGVGVLMYQLITKAVPHSSLQHSSWHDARETILEERWTPHVPEDDLEPYRGVLHQCLSWSPQDRPSVKALLHKSSKPIYAMASDSFEADYLSNAANDM